MLIWILSAGILLSQMLGLLHQVAHAPAGHAPSAASTAAPAKTASGPDWLAKLFDHKKASGDCRLFDQLAHADLMPTVAPVVLPVVPPAFVLLRLEGEAVARWASLFDARGPPAFR